jgi:hypothetical protein
MTEDMIERIAATKFDALDRRFMRHEIDQDEYDRQTLRICDWAERQHRAREMEESRQS